MPLRDLLVRATGNIKTLSCAGFRPTYTRPRLYCIGKTIAGTSDLALQILAGGNSLPSAKAATTNNPRPQSAFAHENWLKTNATEAKSQD